MHFGFEIAAFHSNNLFKLSILSTLLGSALSLFNGFIPLIAIQARLFQLQDHITIVCTKVLDDLPLGLVDEDEEVTAQADRVSWETKVGRASLQLADDIAEMVNEVVPGHRLNYTKYYIGLAKNEAPRNFISLKPSKKADTVLNIKLDRNDELDQRIAASNMESMEYDVRYGQYRLRVDSDDLKNHREFLKYLFQMAHDR